MRLLLTILIAIIVLVAAAILLLPFYLPAGVIKEQVTSAVSEQTGRTLTIDGDVSLSVFPTIQLKASDVRFDNAPGGKAKHMATMGGLDVGLKLLPLLSRNVEVTSFVLSEPVIHLEVDRNGKANWEFEAPDSATTGTASEPGEDGPGSGTTGLSNISLNDVRIEEGRVTYSNAQTGEAYDLSAMNAVARLPSLDKPLSFDGSAIYNKQKVDINSEIGRARALLEGGETSLKASVRSAMTTFDFKGAADFGKKLKLDGDVDLDIPSVKKLAAWTGNPIEGAKDGPGFRAASLTGALSANGSLYKFSNADLKFDAIEAKGQVQADLGGKVPAITGNLTTPLLDLRPYVAETSKSPGSTGSGPAASGEWSTETMDVSALRSFNADLKFAAGGVRVQDVKIGKSQIDMKVKGGVLTATLKELALYKGAGTGRITLDGRRSTPRMNTELRLNGLALAPFLQDAAHTDRFEGIGSFRLNLSGSGKSQAALMRSLGGTANISFADGAIKGVDLNQIASIVNSLTGKDAESEGNTASASGGDNKTKFVTLGGDFRIAKGIIRTKNLKMINELISVSGSGSINLPAQTLDLRLDPGQSQDDGGLKVALRVTGPWSNPKIVPDASALIRNELKDVLGDSPAGSILDQILGGKSDMAEDQPANENKEPTPEELIQKLFD